MTLNARADGGARAADGARARRRGETLETALLDAAWRELVEHGYAGLTFDGVARRAGTSRPVVYRRWATKAELAEAAARHNVQEGIELPDTGTLRGDVLAAIESFMIKRAEAVTTMTIGLAAYYEETGTTMADLRSAILAGRASAMDTMIDRAVARGEVDRDRVTPRIASLPLDLVRHEMVMTLRTPSRETIEEIVDTIFLPLVTGEAPA